MTEFPNLNVGGVKYLCIDLETYDPLLKDSGASWVRGFGHIVGLGLGWADNDGHYSDYYSIGADSGHNLEANQTLAYFQSLANLNIPIIGANIPYDLGWLLDKAVDLTGCKVHDVLTGAQVIDNSLLRYNLDSLCKRWLGREKKDLEVKYGKDVKQKMHLVSVEDAAEYCCQDLDLTMELFDYEQLKFDQYNLWKVFDYESRIIPVTVKMKRQGVAIDLSYIATLKKDFHIQKRNAIQYIKQQLRLYDVEIWSASSVEKIFKRLQIPYPRTTTLNKKTGLPLNNPSFTSDFVGGVGHPCTDALALARKLDKLTQFLTSLQQLEVNGRIHSDYFAGRSDDGGTVTGRFSCANPNSQQIPIRTEDGIKLRAAFIADSASKWQCADFSQQEPRIGVHYASKMGLSGIDYWLDRFTNDPKADFYTLMTEIASISRTDSKTMTLAKSYGMGPGKMSRRLHNTEEESYQMLQEFDLNIPWMKECMDKCMAIGKQRGYIKSLLGRRLIIPRDRPYALMNHLFQCSAAEQMKVATVHIYEEFGIVPLSLIHDEYNSMVDSEKVDIRITQRMKEAVELNIPVKVEAGVGENWMTAKNNCKVY